MRISLRLRSRLERDRCSQLEPFWRVRVFFPHSARPGVWWPNARSSGFARLAFSGRLSSFAALPNEGAPKRLRWVEYSVMSDSVRASVLPIGYRIPDRCVTESASRLTIICPKLVASAIAFEFAHSILCRMHSREVGLRGRQFGRPLFSFRGSFRISYAEGRGTSLFARKCGWLRQCARKRRMEPCARYRLLQNW